MTNTYSLLASILNRPWAISVEYAVNAGTVIAGLLNPDLEFHSGDEPDANKPYAVSVVQDSLKYPDGYNDAPEGSVAVIPIRGELMKYDQSCGPVGMQTLGKRILDSDSHQNISATILVMDGPGGSVDGLLTLEKIIENTSKPIVAFIDGMAASATMRLAAACDKIIASTKFDMLGSIGVMISFADMQPVYEQQGVKFHEIYSKYSGDKNKTTKEVKEGKYENIRTNFLDPLAVEFIEKIKSNRPNVTEDQLTGKMFHAEKLIGTLVDEIGSFEQAIECALSLVVPIIKIIKI